MVSHLCRKIHRRKEVSGFVFVAHAFCQKLDSHQENEDGTDLRHNQRATKLRDSSSREQALKAAKDLLREGQVNRACRKDASKCIKRKSILMLIISSVILKPLADGLQRRHRNRKSEYIKSLEAEVARLQHLDSVVHNEKNMLARQNKAIRDFLASQSIDVQLDSVNLAGANTAKDDLNTLGGATVDIRYDSDLGHDRTFLDLADFSSDMVWTSESSVGDETLSGLPVSQSPVQGNSRAALDFILALEWPCKDHISHAGINPGVEVPVPTDPEHVHGHALTTTAAVFQSALPPWNTNGEDTPQHLSVPNPGQNGHQASPGKWLLPHAEIDK